MEDRGTVGIIGGGLAGLAAGIHLSRRGFRVRLFEAREAPGGCCGQTQAGGFTFNDGAMYVAVPELLDQAFQRLGLDRSSCVPLRRIVANQTTHLPDGTAVSVGEGRDVRILGRNGEARTARLSVEIEHLIARWQPVLRLFASELIPNPFSLGRLLRKGWRHLPKFRGSAGEELDRLFSDPAARAAFSGTLLYTGLPPERMPVFQILGLLALFDGWFYLPEGGMGAIPAALVDAFLSHGGEIIAGARVERLGLSGGRVSHLAVKDGGSVHVDAVISTTSGMHTFGSLIEAGSVPGSMRQKVRRAPLSHQVVSIQLGLSNALEVPSHSNSILPWMEEQHRLFAGSEGIPAWFNYTAPTVTLPELAPPGGSVVEMFLPIPPGFPLERWNEETKEMFAERAIGALRKRHDLSIAVKRIRSPKDYRDGWHLFGGAVYGLSPAADPRAQFPHRTPVEGVFQAGQTTYPGYGVAPALLSGIFAAEAFLKTVRAV